MEKLSFPSLLSLAQGFFYLVTGIWPVLDESSFQKITGPKVDMWLVKTIGVLIGVIGGVLVQAGLRRRVHPAISLLAVGTATTLAGSDLIYVAKKRIPPVYLLDALAELVLVILWGGTLDNKHRREQTR